MWRQAKLTAGAALNPKLCTLYVDPGRGLFSGWQEDVWRIQVRSLPASQDSGGELEMAVPRAQ